ncbi:MAG: ATP-binding protein [Candidatus Eisenbacteria bacterium]|nr:ATP-binding protein [Candidatus Eisenbacteria bacterium]
MSLLERFNDLSVSDIEQFVARREPETLHLEFKRAADEEFAKQPTRSKLAEMISGFANSDGGIVVWGVDARPLDGIDAARELAPLKRPEVFASRLKALLPDATTPAVEDVLVRVLSCEDGQGFVVTLVPASDGGPHLAKYSEDRYIRRTGDRFVRMEHYEVADMFGRRRRPVLSLRHTLRFDSTYPLTRESSEWRLDLILAVGNSGRGVARAPYLALRTSTNRAVLAPYGLTGNGGDGLPRLASVGGPAWAVFGGSMEMVVHPGTRHDVTKYSLRFPNRLSALEAVRIDYRLTAEGSTLVEDGLVITPDDLAASIPPTELPPA